ncbi:MAG: hypothetical protein DSY60_02500 [Persephonella sp.]|nr:MAG: hypothetical protein DSY60_02500 [Persephonella sp.]
MENNRYKKFIKIEVQKGRKKVEDMDLIDEKVKKIKEQISKNEYKISSEKVAEKMLEFLKRFKKK